MTKRTEAAIEELKALGVTLDKPEDGSRGWHYTTTHEYGIPFTILVKSINEALSLARRSNLESN